MRPQPQGAPAGEGLLLQVAWQQGILPVNAALSAAGLRDGTRPWCGAAVPRAHAHQPYSCSCTAHIFSSVRAVVALGWIAWSAHACAVGEVGEGWGRLGLGACRRRRAQWCTHALCCMQPSGHTVAPPHCILAAAPHLRHQHLSVLGVRAGAQRQRPAQVGRGGGDRDPSAPGQAGLPPARSTSHTRHTSAQPVHSARATSAPPGASLEHAVQRVHVHSGRAPAPAIILVLARTLAAAVPR